MSQCRNARVESGTNGHRAATMTAGQGGVAGMAEVVGVAADAGTAGAVVVRYGGRPYSARSA
jgi:pyruvate/2-oxoacid:ferredoxin oxidoreductase alpha subunit